MSTNEHGVTARHLTKMFGAALAVDDLSFTVARGEIYGLLGPNGAGKTTTLRMLAAILAPTSGSASLAGVDVARDPQAARRQLGFLTGSTGLYARLTGRELLRYFGRLHHMPEDAIAARTALLAGVLDLEGILAKRCEALSTGQRQRLSVARAVLHDPTVLILDEPTVGLDVLASRFLRDFVRAERDRGKAVIFSTHYLAEAELLCDRIGLLHRGRMLAEDTPGGLRARAGDASSLEEAFLRLVAGLTADPEVRP
ncbi:MAG TPA: ATP-binding cassette domain-containing protein [Polyangia bacterium]|jgi:sodium transport system ATP-binding protein|nr:ATP-binding cassette domain-containing protein [Polyangia bacterium]